VGSLHDSDNRRRGAQTGCGIANGGRTLRILAVNWRDIADPMAGGAEIHLHEILRRCVAAGHEVNLVASGYPGAAPAGEIDGVRVHRRGHWLVANYALPPLVRRLLSRRPYDLLIEDINKIPFYAPLYSRGVPVLAIVPHLFGTTVFRETNPVFASYVWAAERAIPRVYRRATFEVISPSTREDLVSRGLAPESIRTIYCGLDQERFHLDDPPPRSQTPLVVTWSRLRRYKSIDVAIRAFALILERLPQARFLIMGRGPDESRLRRLVARLGLVDRVTFKGFLPWTELVRTLHRCHTFLNPSPKEGWGLTVVEANRCGIPVVASDRPGLRDSVRPDETGFLVPYGDSAAFAAAALRQLTEPELWRAQHEAALRWARTFSWDRCARESLSFFEEIAGAARGAPPGRRSS
jgi:glycosyltransferase involved in cell wall biosynthesis